MRVEAPGAADKAASLMRCKSSAVNCLVRTASISDACEGNDTGSARTEKPRLPCGDTVAVGETWVANKPGRLNKAPCGRTFKYEACCQGPARCAVDSYLPR